MSLVSQSEPGESVSLVSQSEPGEFCKLGESHEFGKFSESMAPKSCSVLGT